MEIPKPSSKKMVSVAYERLSFNDLTGENFSVLIGRSVWELRWSHMRVFFSFAAGSGCLKGHKFNQLCC